MKVLVFTFVTILAFSEAYEALNSTIVKTVKAAIMSDVYKGIDLKFVTQAIRLSKYNISYWIVKYSQ